MIQSPEEQIAPWPAHVAKIDGFRTVLMHRPKSPWRVGVLRTQGFLPDGEGALIERLGLGVLTLVVIQRRQVVEARGHEGCFRPQGLLLDGEGALIERPGLGVLALSSVDEKFIDWPYRDLMPPRAMPMAGNPPLSLFDAGLFLAHGHFIAVPNELIGDPGVDVDDRKHYVAQQEKQGHAPREIPLVLPREKRFRTVPGAAMPKSRRPRLIPASKRHRPPSSKATRLPRRFQTHKKAKGFPPHSRPARLPHPDIAQAAIAERLFERTIDEIDGEPLAAHELRRGGVLRDLGAERANSFPPPLYRAATTCSCPGRSPTPWLRRNIASAPQKC